ncbi:hypothetical protein [uncultured Algibacter sp.]|uniref:hypothetical protein n=1 Tax=uncultured Algibacter sp. TaxID=298659 RepID=UPI003217B367
MKYILILGLVLLSTSCKPQNAKNKNMDELDKKIEEIVNYATKNLPDYANMDKLPDLYNIMISSSNCRYQILINDLLNTSFLDDSEGHISSKSKGINSSLLVSGTTPIEIRLLPPTGKKTLDKYASISVKIEHIPHLGNAEGRKIIWTYEMPMLDYPLPRFIHKDVFEVTVPFEIKDLENATDLTTLDTKQLKKEVHEQFAVFEDILRRGDGIALLEITRERERRSSIKWYSTKEEIKKSRLKFVERTQKSTLLPLPEPKLELYGNGKLATLRNAKTLEAYFWMDDGDYYFGRTLYVYKTKDGKWHVW